MAYFKAHIKYKTKKTGGWTTHNLSASQIKGNTESAVMELLSKKHPDHEIVILSIEWD